jgi:hypothetical protein
LKGKRNIVLVVAVSALLVTGTSFALKRLGIDNRASGFSTSGSYRDNVLKASLGGSSGYSGGCNTSGGGCNSSAGAGSSSCCSGDGSGSLSVEQVRAGALNYYAQKYGDTEVVCEVKDYGCHMEATILKDGNAVKRLSISNGNISEIG